MVTYHFWKISLQDVAQLKTQEIGVRFAVVVDCLAELLVDESERIETTYALHLQQQ